MHVNQKIVSMEDYVLDIDFMTTNEFCTKYRVPLPTIIDGVKSFLQIDAIKQRFYVEYAKFLTLHLSERILVNDLGFKKEINSEYINTYSKDEYVLYELENDVFVLSEKKTARGWILHKVRDFVGRGIEYRKKL